MTKICSKCGIEKDTDSFYKDKCQKDGYQTQCKSCKKYYNKINAKHINLISKQWREKHPNYNKEYDAKRKTIKSEYNKKYGIEHKENIRQQHKLYYQNNKEKIKNYSKNYNNLKPRNRNKFNDAFSNALHRSLKGSNKYFHWEDIVNYNLHQLKQHLELQFESNMTWSNYGSYWEIDHIIPINTFNITGYDHNFKICWSLMNLRPLEKITNRKRPKDGSDIPECLKQRILNQEV